MNTLEEVRKEMELIYSKSLEQDTMEKLEELWKISLLEDFIDKSKYTIYIENLEPVVADKDGIINEEETEKLKKALKLFKETQRRTKHIEHLFSISGLDIMDKALIYVIIYTGVNVKTVKELKKEMNKYQLCTHYDEGAIKLEIGDSKIYFKTR